MSTINLIQYSRSIEPNKATKIRVFNDFFCNEFGIKNHNEDIDVYFLAEIDVEFIVRSLEYYIDVNKVAAQNPANTYVNAIFELLQYIAQEYNAKNPILTALDIQNDYFNRTKEIISKLRNTVSKDIATDDDFEMLINCVNLFIEDHNNIELELNKEIGLLISNKRKNLWIYPSFISVIATKLILKYALKYNVITSLKVTDVSLENNLITINNISLPMSSDLAQLLKIYIPIRKELLAYYDINHDKLLVKYKTGKPYLREDYGTLFVLMENSKSFTTFKSESFSSKRILEMLDNGIDTYLITKLTGFELTRCVIDIQSKNRSAESENVCVEKLINFISDKKHVNTQRSLTCPFCGVKKNANIENWVIVKFEGDDNKYIACRGCKGLANREYLST